MSQQGLSAPTSRQDIISALLNDYATSFGRGDACTSVYSPVQELKSLPPTPNDIPRKQLPPGVQAMHAKFQLRGKQTLLFLYSGSLSMWIQFPHICFCASCKVPRLFISTLVATWLHAMRCARAQPSTGLYLTCFRETSSRAQNHQLGGLN